MPDKVSPDVVKKKLTCISQSGVHALAQREKMCQKCQLDLLTRTDAYERLLKEDHPPIQFWQTPTFVVGGITVGVGLGALLAVTKGFGLWN